MEKDVALSKVTHARREERTHALQEEELLLKAVRRLNSSVLGLVLGSLFGLLLFASTLFLVAKGGVHVGFHLSLLNQFFPGYSVTVLGSFVGFFYGFLTGFVSGWFVGWVYNTIAGLQ